MNKKIFFKCLGTENILRFCILGFVALITCFSHLYAMNLTQIFLCMGYAQSLAHSTPFSVYAETITLAPSPFAYGLPHVYLMSFLIRAGIDAYWAYDIVLVFWIFLSLFACIRLCRMLNMGPIFSLSLPLFVVSLPSIIFHQQYSALGIGYLLIPFYVWTATALFLASSVKERIIYTLLFAFVVTFALFMDGYSFISAVFLMGGVYLVCFNRKNWKWHLFYDPCVILISCAVAYILYSKFIGAKCWDSYSRPIFSMFRALPIAYFLPIAKGFSVLGDYFSYTPAQHPDYIEDFLFCLPLLVADFILLVANGGKLHKRWQYWLMWCLTLVAFWLSLGPDVFLDSGKRIATGNWFIYQYLPGFNVMRATIRWGIIVHILLAAILCVSIINTRLKDSWVVFLLCAVYFFQYFPSSHNFIQNKNGKSHEQLIRKKLARDLDGKLKKGDTVLFIPIRNSFVHLYFASVHNANTWNTGCDKNVRILIRAYPPEVLPLVNKIHENRALSLLDPFPAAFQIMKILLLTDVDTVVFDYNAAYSIAIPPFRNLLKKDAVAIEKVLKKTGFIIIDHSQYFAYYRIDKAKLPGTLDKVALAKIERSLGRENAYHVKNLGIPLRLDQLKNAIAGFYSPINAGGWASTSVKFFLQLNPKWFQEDCDVILYFDVHPASKKQHVDIFSNGKLLKTDDVTSRRVLSLPIRKDQLSEDGFLDLEFIFPNAFFPTGEERFLSCYFHSFMVDRVAKTVGAGKSIPINGLTPYLDGFFPPEPHGRWAGKSCDFRLPLSRGTVGNLRFSFSGWPISSTQVMKIFDSQGQILQTLSLPKAGSYNFAIPEWVIKDDTLVFHLEFPNASCPQNGDQRILSFFFSSIKLDMLDDGTREIDFSKSNPFCTTGFSGIEPWGRWSNAKNCFMRFLLPLNRKSEMVRLQFTCRAFEKMRSVKIYCNGQYTDTWKISRHDAQIYNLNLRIPLSQREIELRFEQFDLASPKDILKTNDNRQLGLGFISMKSVIGAQNKHSDDR